MDFKFTNWLITNQWLVIYPETYLTLNEEVGKVTKFSLTNDSLVMNESIFYEIIFKITFLKIVWIEFSFEKIIKIISVHEPFNFQSLK